MVTRINNLIFFADTEGGQRRPKATNIEVEPDPVENPDPNGDGGGSQNPGGNPSGGDGDGGSGDPDQGTGGDIGNPDGSAVITTGDAPVITRKSHNQNIFPQQSTTMSITYVIDRDGTLLPKGGHPDMMVSYSSNGREMTLSWLVPSNQPGDSTYIGAEAWVYGGDSVESVSILWDRLHIGKNAGDLTYGGKNTDQPIIHEASKARMTNAGSTLILTDGEYTDNRDIFNVGFENVTGNSATEISNGINSQKTSTDHASVSFTDYNIQKYTCIMAETPLGVVMNRQGKDGGIVMNGNGAYPNRGNANGNRSTIGIHVLGIEVLNGAFRQIQQQKTYKTKVSYSMANQSTTYPNPQGNTNWVGDASCAASLSSANTLLENCGVIGNERLLIDSDRFTFNATYRNVIANAGAVQMVNENISQCFIAYTGQQATWHNCYNMDAADFALASTRANNQNFFLNYAFVCTNGGNNNAEAHSCLSLRDVRLGWLSDNSGRATGVADKIRNSVFWDKVRIDGRGVSGPQISGGRIDVDGCLVGKNGFHFGISGVLLRSVDGNQSNLNNVLSVSPTWDYGQGNDTIFNGNLSDIQNVGTVGVVSNYGPSSNITNAADSYYSTTRNNAQSQGIKYISRREQNSAIDVELLGSNNIFALVGEYGKFRDESNYDTVYNGIGAPYVNAISRGPWAEIRASRRKYNCTSRGINVTGNSGWAREGYHPVDYINRFGTTPENPINTPYIEDIYGYLDDNGNPVIAWRPVCPAYRSTITGYDIYIDRIKVTSNQPKETTSFKFTTKPAAGVRLFNVVVKDQLYGDSGFSRTVFLNIS